MYVITRSGKKESVNFEKIHKRIERLTKEPYELKNVNCAKLTQFVIQGLVDGISTSEIDEYSSRLSAESSIDNIEYGILAGRICVDNHRKNTLNSFRDKINILYNKTDIKGMHRPLICELFHKYVERHQSKIDHHIKYDLDRNFDFFGFKTLEKSYLLRVDKKIIERPQDMYMRVAIQLHMPESEEDFDDLNYLNKIFETYDMLSSQHYTHATPTMFNAGTPNAQMSSCYVQSMDDSLEGIMHTLTESVNISKWSGGVGFEIYSLRSRGSPIHGTNGYSDGIIPFLRMFNDGARAFNQGGGKRKGSFAAYLAMHHADLMDFLNLKKSEGDINVRCPDLFTALWVPDLFIKRLKKDKPWSVFDPNECPLLNTTYGDEYEAAYLDYESRGLAKYTYNIKKVIDHIAESQMEKGVPYILFSDTFNKYSMQKNIGLIKSSNLCTEISLVSDPKHTSVCNLASICLNQFVKDSYTKEELTLQEDLRRKLDHKFPKNPIFDYVKLAKVAGMVTENINQVIDRTWNPIASSARTNFQNRPIGIGIQALNEVFMMFRFSFESEQAADMNKKIAEAIYYGALSKSTELCRNIYKNLKKKIRKHGTVSVSLYPEKILEQFPELKSENVVKIFSETEKIPNDIGAYPNYHKIGKNGEEAPIKSKFHWELYGLKKEDLSGLFDWDSLREHINTYGVRNSTLTAYMPTASTSQINGNTPSFEPNQTNIYKRYTLAGSFVVINKYLINDLINAGLWNEDMKNYLLMTEGSIQQLEGIPKEIKDLYKTVWEIKQKTIIDLAAGRAPFVDQSQSMNIYVHGFDSDKCASIMVYAHEKGLKTAVYYTYVKPAVEAQKFTISPTFDMKKVVWNIPSSNKEEDVNETCLLCSS